MKAIELHNIGYSYPGCETFSLQNIDLNVEKGQFILVTGPSGCGKSTLARLLCRLAPDFYGGKVTGEIRLLGKDLKELSKRDIPSLIGMIFQNPERQIIMDSVANEIAFGLENIATPEETIKDKLQTALEKFGLKDIENKKTRILSSGQKQSLAIASILAMSPSILILDEPSSQLDKNAADNLSTLLKELQSSGHTIVMFEHRINSYLPLADRVIFMERGKIVFESSRDNFHADLEKTSSEYSRAFEILSNTASFKVKPLENELLKINDLNFSYDKSRPLLSELGLTIYPGEFVSILGGNGTGKTTLLRLISGLIKPLSGTIFLMDLKVSDAQIKEIAKHAGFLSQNPNDYLFNDTVEEELSFTQKNYAKPDGPVLAKTLNLLDLSDLRSSYPRDLSTGQRQRIALGSIMVNNPSLLMLDEPTRGLDAVLKVNLGNALREGVEKENKSVLLVTQDENFARAFSDRILRMDKGKLQGY